MNPERGVTILLSTLVIFASAGLVYSTQSHSYNAARVFFGIDVVLFGVFATVRPKLVMRALRTTLGFIFVVLGGIAVAFQEITQAVIEWKRRREEDRAREETERLERQIRINADATNQETRDLQKHATPHFMLGLDPVEFEHYVLRYFRAIGYDAQETKVTGDGGIDGKLWRDRRLYLVQCKRYKENSVGEPPVRDLLGAVTKAKATGGFFVTTSSFTPTAVRFANGTSIKLIDGKALAARIMSIPLTDPIDRVTSPMREDGTENGSSPQHPHNS